MDDQMRTSDPNIFAVGDAVEVKDFVTGEWTLIPLARTGEPAGPDRRRRCDCGAGLPVPGHPGNLGGRGLRRHRRQHRREREAPHQAGPNGLREDIPLPELARWVLPGRQDDRAEGHLPEDRRPSAGAQALGIDCS